MAGLALAWHDDPMAGRRKPSPPVDAERIAKAAERYLERFSASVDQLRRVLMRRVLRSARENGTSPEDGRALVEAEIERLRVQGVLDDGRFAWSRAASLVRRGDSPAAIRGKLAAKGVARGEIDRAIAALAADVEDLALSAAVALARRRRLGPFRPDSDRAKFRDKDLATMARAGYSRDVARRVVDSPDADSLQA